MKKLFVFSFLLVFALVLIPSSTVLAANAEICAADATTVGSTGKIGSTCGSVVTTTEKPFCFNGTIYQDRSACCTAAGSQAPAGCTTTTPAPGTGSGLNIDFVKPGLRGIQTQGNLDTIEQLAAFVTKIGNYLFTFLMAAAVILIIWGAFDFIAGGGDPKRIETARQKIMWAFVGIAIALLAVFFAPIVRSFLGVSIAP